MDSARGAQNWKEDETIHTQKKKNFKVNNSTKACISFDIQAGALIHFFFFKLGHEHLYSFVTLPGYMLRTK